MAVTNRLYFHYRMLMILFASHCAPVLCSLFWWILLNNGLQHKGAMSTKPVFEKTGKIQRSYVPLCGHTSFAFHTPAPTMTKAAIGRSAVYHTDQSRV